MTLLLVLTLVYIAVLVLALASGLIAIVYFLNQARANLKQIAAGLEQVDKNVAPLQKALSAANNGLALILADLEKTDENLSVKEDSKPEPLQPAVMETRR
jgi:uncharacterized protein YoxC